MESSLFEHTITLSEDFLLDSELPFDSTHGLTLQQKDATRASKAIVHNTPPLASLQHQKRLEKLAPYAYSPQATQVHSQGATPDIETSWTHDFEKKGLLGVGGEGAIHLAQQHSLQREVAIKSLHKVENMEQTQQRLLHEATIMGQLEHPNVIPVHTLGRDSEGQPFLVMKKVSGDSWRDLMRNAQHKAWSRLRFWSEDPLVRHLEILLQVCNAIEHAHQCGIIHRDIKPANVMVGEYGEVYLIDWGLALSDTFIAMGSTIQLKEYLEHNTKSHNGKRILCGTPTYMAPEMFLCDEAILDQRTDVYLLGATLYEIIESHPPHGGKHIHEHMLSSFLGIQFSQEDEALQELLDICKHAMQIEPSERFQDVESFREAIGSFLRHRTSMQLYQQAKSSHSQLEHALVQAPLQPVVQDNSTIYNLFTESRFGYLQALREWTKNPLAQMGYQRCLEQMIQFHLQQRSVVNTEALLAQLPQENEELTQRLEQLRQELEEEAQQKEDLQNLRFELDNSLSHQERFTFVGWMSIPVFILSAIFIFFDLRSTPILKTSTLFWIAFYMLILYMVVLLVKYRKWTKNTFDHRFTVFFGLTIIALVLHRGCAWSFGYPPLEVLLVDMCIMILLNFTGALFFRPLILTGLMSIFFTALSVWQLQWVRELSDAYCLSVVLFLFLLKRRERKQALKRQNS